MYTKVMENKVKKKNIYGEVPMLDPNKDIIEQVYLSKKGKNHFIPIDYRAVYSKAEMENELVKLVKEFEKVELPLCKENLKALTEASFLSHGMPNTTKVLKERGFLIKAPFVKRKVKETDKALQAFEFYRKVDWFRQHQKLNSKEKAIAEKYRMKAFTKKTQNKESDFYKFRIPGTTDYMIGTLSALEDLRSLFPNSDLSASLVKAPAEKSQELVHVRTKFDDRNLKKSEGCND